METIQLKPVSLTTLRGHVGLMQRWIHPVRLAGGAISAVSGSQVSLWVRYCKCRRDEIYFTTLVWQNSGRQNGLKSRMLFSELYKIMVNKVTFVGFRGRSPPSWFDAYSFAPQSFVIRFLIRCSFETGSIEREVIITYSCETIHLILLSFDTSPSSGLLTILGNYSVKHQQF